MSVSSARPPAVALFYLVNLVTQTQQFGGREDPRIDEQIANDFGETPIFHMGLKDISPQQTALNLFNRFYIGCEAKVRLSPINNPEIQKPDLLETILCKLLLLAFQ